MWSLGRVESRQEHFQLRYHERLVARVGRHPDAQMFIVDFVSAEPDARLAAEREITFYLQDKQGEADPWAYAIYHCTTASNLYSMIHWTYVPRGEAVATP